jgi:selenoprotein W-related protein
VAELKDRFGDANIQPELVGGSGGVFDVEIDGKLVFSKKQTGNFPRYREIVSKIEEMQMAS